jgi:hypothetical protein
VTAAGASTLETKAQPPQTADDTGDGADKTVGSVPEDAADEKPVAAEASADTNGDAEAKKGSKRKSGGVPEHKGKKLNKKKSMPKITHLDAKPGDYFFARLKSYPPWPAIICDEDMLPSSLLSTRPVTTKKPDGTYNEAYVDGGKKVTERTFPVMFLYTNEL